MEEQWCRDGTAAAQLSALRNPELAGWPHSQSCTHRTCDAAINDLRLKWRNSKASACLPPKFAAVINVWDDLREERSCMPYQQNRSLLRASNERLGQDSGRCIALATPKYARWCFW